MSFMDREKDKQAKAAEARRIEEARVASDGRFGFQFRVNGGPVPANSPGAIDNSDLNVHELAAKQRGPGQVLSARGWVESQRRGGRYRPKFSLT
jgi:hypothetical protein